MPTWEATDPKTGKVVEFDWHGVGAPSDRDLDEIFTEAYKATPPSSLEKVGGTLGSVWAGYEGLLGLPGKAADAFAGAITSPFMETPLTAAQLAHATSPMGIGEGLVSAIPGVKQLQARQQAEREAKHPNIEAAGRGIGNLTDRLAGDPTTYMPFLGGPKLAAAFAPAILKGAGEADLILAETIMQEGWSPRAVERLVDAAGSSAFAALLLGSMKKGKPPRKSIEEAFKETKSKAKSGDELMAELDALMDPKKLKASEGGGNIEDMFQRVKKDTLEAEGANPLIEQMSRERAFKPRVPEGEVGALRLSGEGPKSLADFVAEAADATPELDPTVEGGGSSALSAEELRRSLRGEVYYRVNADGSLSYQGPQPDPAGSLRPGEGVVKVVRGQNPEVVQANGSYSTVHAKFNRSEVGRGLPMADQPVGARPWDPGIESAGSLLGAVSPQNVKDFVRASTDFARASVAGQFGVSVRNVASGWRQIIEATIGNPLAAAQAAAKAQVLESMGQQRKAASYREAAKNFLEVGKAYPVATWRGIVDTMADAADFLKNKGQASPPSGRFAQDLQVLKATGNRPLAERMKAFSDPTFGRTGQIRKFMMFFSILGDRFVNRTFLDAGVQGLQNHFGAKTIPDLLAHLDGDQAAMDFARDSLAEATGEAFRASWQQMSPEKTLSRNLVSKMETTALGNVIGLVTNPFPRALLSNMLPNIIEKTPLFFLSKRVQNSYKHFNLRGQRELLRESIAKQTAQGQVNAADVKALRKVVREMTSLEKDTIYHPSMIAARVALGGVVASAFAARRLMSGDDLTEFDELKVPGTDRIASLTSQLGEDLPFAFVGDIMGHWLLSQQTGKPFKYEGKDGVVKIGDLGRALYGSRYGMPTPGLDLAGELAGAMLGTGGGDEVKVDYLQRLMSGVLEGLGRMYGAGAWLGEGARSTAELMQPEEAKVRRTDVGPQDQALIRGFQSQIPGMRQELPESPRWSKLDVGKREFPVASLAGYEQTLAPLEKFMRANRIDPGDVLPRRSEDPKFDLIYLEKFKQQVEKNVFPKLERSENMTQAGRASWFESIMKRTRAGAKRLAEVEYKRQTGQPAPSILKEREQEKKKRSLRREAVLPPL
jgi:hypothetical protein